MAVIFALLALGSASLQLAQALGATELLEGMIDTGSFEPK